MLLRTDIFGNVLARVTDFRIRGRRSFGEVGSVSPYCSQYNVISPKVEKNLIRQGG